MTAGQVSPALLGTSLVAGTAVQETQEAEKRLHASPTESARRRKHGKGSSGAGKSSGHHPRGTNKFMVLRKTELCRFFDAGMCPRASGDSARPCLVLQSLLFNTSLSASLCFRRAGALCPPLLSSTMRSVTVC